MDPCLNLPLVLLSNWGVAQKNRYSWPVVGILMSRRRKKWQHWRHGMASLPGAMAKSMATGDGSRTLKPDVNFTFQISKCCFKIQDHQKILKIFLEMELRQVINDDKRKCVSLSFSNVKLSNDDDDWAFQELVWRGIEGQGMLISDIGSRPRKKWRSGTELWCRRRTPDWPRNSYSHAAMDKQKYIWIKNKWKAYLVFILSAMLLFSLGYWDSK